MRVLYHIPLSAQCRKIRVALREKEMAFQLIVELPWQPAPGFEALNPAGDMPVLVDDDGTVVRGGYATGEYLEEVYPHIPLLGHSSSERAEIRRLVDWFDGRFAQSVSNPLVHEKIFKKLMQQGEPDSRILRSSKEQLPYHLEYITNLVEQRGLLVGDHVTLADIAAASHLSCLDYMGDVPWEHYPRVREWYAILKSRPSFRAVLSDRVPPFRPPAHYENPDF